MSIEYDEDKVRIRELKIFMRVWMVVALLSIALIVAMAFWGYEKKKEADLARMETEKQKEEALTQKGIAEEQKKEALYQERQARGAYITEMKLQKTLLELKKAKGVNLTPTEQMRYTELDEKIKEATDKQKKKP